MKEGIAEFLQRVANEKSRPKKIEMLRSGHNTTLETIIDIHFNPNIKFIMPEGIPSDAEGNSLIKLSPKEADLQSMLYATIRKLGIFLDPGTYPNMKDLQREGQFLQFLESIVCDDAKMILAMKDGKMPFKGITKKLFEEAWPALASTWVKKDDGQNSKAA